MNGRFRESLPVLLAIGVPALTAAITVAYGVADVRLADGALSRIAGASVPLVNAALAFIAAAAAGFLRRDEFGFRVLYLVFPLGATGLLIHLMALVVLGGFTSPLWS